MSCDIETKILEPKNITILNDYSNCMIEFREQQTSLLKIRLNIFIKTAIEKYKSLDNIVEGNCAPVNSNSDVNIINKLIEMKSFITIPIFNRSNSITHFYTIGLWYFWGLPELVIKFTEPIKQNADFINIITNIIYDKFFEMYKNKITMESNQNNKIINRLDFELEPNQIKLEIDKFNICFNMKKVEHDKYMELNAIFMMWFYMYYMQAPVDKDNQPKLYPIYEIIFNEVEFSEIAKSIMNKLIEISLDKINDIDLKTDDSNTSNEDDNISNSSDSLSLSDIDN